METVDGVHNRRFRLIIQRRGGFIQHQYLRILKQCPGNTDTLPLPAGKTDSPLPDSRIQPLRKPSHKFIQLRFLQRLPYLGIINILIRHAESNILSDRCINHENSLRNIADIFQPLLIVFPHFHAVSQDPALLDIQKPQKDVNDRRLSGTRGTYHAHGAAHGNFHLCVIKNQGLRVGIFINNILQFYFRQDRKLGNLLFPAEILLVIIHVPVIDILLQVIAYPHEKGLKVGN